MKKKLKNKNINIKMSYFLIIVLLISVISSTYLFFKQREEISNLRRIIANSVDEGDYDGDYEDNLEIIDCDISGLRKENKSKNISFKELDVITSQGSSNQSDSVFLLSQIEGNYCKYDLTNTILKSLGIDSLNFGEYENILYLANQNAIVLKYKNEIVKINLDQESKSETLIKYPSNISGPLGYYLSGPISVSLSEKNESNIADAFVVYGVMEGGCEFDGCFELAGAQRATMCKDGHLGIWTFDDYSGKSGFTKTCDISLM